MLFTYECVCDYIQCVCGGALHASNIQNQCTGGSESVEVMIMNLLRASKVVCDGHSLKLRPKTFSFCWLSGVNRASERFYEGFMNKPWVGKW